MPFVRSLAFKCYTYIIAIIFLLSKIISTYSCYVEKKLVYIIIIAPFSRQPSFYFKYTKSNICLSCDVRLISNIKCIFRFPYNIYSPSQLLGGNN